VITETRTKITLVILNLMKKRSDMPIDKAKNPVILVHGYSDSGESFKKWKKELEDKLPREVHTINVCNYITLSNEITIKDIAEGFDRALRRVLDDIDNQNVAADSKKKAAVPFDAIVHSTGMLVVRSWLATYGSVSEGRRNRLKRLIALAPATFGSPLAHKGRSWLGGIFKGNKDAGPDFLEAGDQVLDGLELGSRFTWDLAEKDLFAKESFYDLTENSPYVFVFCGNRAYEGLTLRRLVNEPAMDGTVRWAGCGLNSRKITIDLTVDPLRGGNDKRFKFGSWPQQDMPVYLVDKLNHSTILSDPTPELVNLVVKSLGVTKPQEYINVCAEAKTMSDNALNAVDNIEWQQFVVRCVDERGDPIRDYFVQLVTQREGDPTSYEEIDTVSLNVHAYTADPSFRCFHVDLKELYQNDFSGKRLFIKVMASSGSSLVGYWGHGFDATPRPARGGKRGWDAMLEITPLLSPESEIKFFKPWTTTMVEIRLNREPIPFNRDEISDIVKFL
jgi:pimeloyl-ACP methyl ester carboxylesterase